LFQSSIALPFSCFYTSKIALNILNQGLGNLGKEVWWKDHKESGYEKFPITNELREIGPN
jgi:hypothetical protein